MASRVQARLVQKASPVNGGRATYVRVIAQGTYYTVSADALWQENGNAYYETPRKKIASFSPDSSLDREEQVRVNARAYFPQIEESDMAEVQNYFFPGEE